MSLISKIPSRFLLETIKNTSSYTNCRLTFGGKHTQIGSFHASDYAITFNTRTRSVTFISNCRLGQKHEIYLRCVYSGCWRFGHSLLNRVEEHQLYYFTLCKRRQHFAILDRPVPWDIIPLEIFQWDPEAPNRLIRGNFKSKVMKGAHNLLPIPLQRNRFQILNFHSQPLTFSMRVRVYKKFTQLLYLKAYITASLNWCYTWRIR